jgi:polyisoprenoid-binding protein YceI
MEKKTMLKKLLIIGVVIGVIAAGFIAYQFLKPTEAASQPIQAAAIATATPAMIATATQAMEVPVTAPTSTPAAEAQPASASASGELLFEIDPAQSEARFKINEVLNGSPKTVIGVTDQVGGQISVDRAAPANTRLGVIQVNARTLTTDNEFRNRAIKNRILMTNDHEFITFSPQTISGFPAVFEIGQAFTLQVEGDLTVKGVTKPVTFEVQVTPASETQITGSAATTVLYKDFGIAIPEVPSVTGVEDQVVLEIDFVANRVN